jgi:hypothetical protein
MTRGLLALTFVAGAIAGAVATTALRGPDVPPAWHEGSALAGPRTYAQAVTLATGEILVVGGMDRDRTPVTNGHAEILDPRAGTVRLDGAARIPRLWQTLTPLPNDLVLVVGGTLRREDGDWQALAYAETFDPWTGRWRAVAAPAVARSDHSAVLLHDGRVLVIGGNDGPRWIRQSEVYDPRTDSWSRAAALPNGRTRFTAVTLPDGRVLVAGGLEQPGPATDRTLLYDPATDSWSEGPRMLAKRAIHASVVLPDGDVLFIGGQNDGSNTAERYSLKSGTFEFAGTLAWPRMFGQAALLDDGSVLYAGGIVVPQRGFDPTPLAERWDPRTERWSDAPPLRTGRAGGAIVAAPGGVWLIGGSVEDDHAIASVELFR